jgi:hypothetical protein
MKKAMQYIVGLLLLIGFLWFTMLAVAGLGCGGKENADVAEDTAGIKDTIIGKDTTGADQGELDTLVKDIMGGDQVKLDTWIEDGDASGQDSRYDVSEQIELAYDDGTAEEMFSPWGPTVHVQIAVMFTAPSYPVRLVGARFWVSNWGKPSTPFAVRVYAADDLSGKPGTPLLPPDKIMGSAANGHEWVDVDLSSAGLTVSGDFFVAMDWLTAPGDQGGDAQFLGADHNSPDRRTWWLIDPSKMTWVRVEKIGTPPTDRDAMIRAIVEY